MSQEGNKQDGMERQGGNETLRKSKAKKQLPLIYVEKILSIHSPQK